MSFDADPHLATPSGKPRARALGLMYGGVPGPWNAITDVSGVEVGYVTLIEGDDVRTGVTAIHPRGREHPADPVAAGFHSQNGNGEMTGVSWIEESGTFSLPVAITTTHAVGVAHAGIVAWTVKHHRSVAERWLLPVAAETCDAYLNDINGHHVTEDAVVTALESARPGPVEEGSVGGGTGMNCYQYKGGSGTASRVVPYGGGTHTVGVFVQANFGRRRELVLAGLALGEELADDNPMEEFLSLPPGLSLPSGAGSVIAIVATDAPLLPHQCKTLARRVTSGLARTGTSGSHFSGDLFLAFSTANAGSFTPEGAFGSGAAPDSGAVRGFGGAPGSEAVRGFEAGPGYDRLMFIPWSALDPFCEAVVQATEEAVANALVANEDMTGRAGHRTPALPRDRVSSRAAALNSHRQQ
jgi:L-aminopeptidase/D-esterase-like protein